jgi:diguanylate cyclase (GGDEF)-like protein
MNLPHSGNPNGVQTISIGVAAADPAKNVAMASLLTDSDHALYRAKYMGRNRVEGATEVTRGMEMSAQD